MSKVAKPCCAQCGGTRFTYTDHQDIKHIVIPFAIPADSPLDDSSIKQYGVQHAMNVAVALLEERKRRGKKSSPIILPGDDR